VRARFLREDTVVAGCTFHSSYSEGALEPESGVWFWAEIRSGSVNYCLGGADLESSPIRFEAGPSAVLEEDGEFLQLRDSWKILVQGSYGCIYPRVVGKRKTRIPWTARRPSGHVAFFNYSATARDALEVDFRDVTFTLLNTGPAMPPNIFDSRFGQSFGPSENSLQAGNSIDMSADAQTVQVAQDAGQEAEQQATQQNVLARTASDPGGLRIQYGAPLDVPPSSQSRFEPAYVTQSRMAAKDAKKRGKKTARRADPNAGVPRIRKNRGDVLSFG